MNKVKVGVVGLHFGRGMLAEHILRGPGSPYFEVAALCDADPQRLAAVTQEFHLPGHGDLEALLQDPTLAAIFLFTGPEHRPELIRRIVRAGKHVLTTKPFALDPVAAAAALAEAQRLGRVVHLNSPAPLPPPELALLRQWREQFNLGRAVACNASVWCSYREQPDGSWYDDPIRCPVAPILRLGIYLINDLVRVLGPADLVQVVHSRLFTRRPTADNAQLNVKFADGALGHIFASFCVDDGHYYDNTMVWNFERGTVTVNGHHARLAIKDTAGRPTTEEAKLPGRSGDYQWEAFARAVHGEKLTDAVTAAAIVAGVKILAAMARADRSGNTERV